MTPDLDRGSSLFDTLEFTHDVQAYKLLVIWSGRLDSNQRPPRPERGALPTALRPDVQFNFRDFLQNWAIYIRY